MYSFTSGLTDFDEIALLRHGVGQRQRLLDHSVSKHMPTVALPVPATVPGMDASISSLASAHAHAHGLSASELMSASSLHDRERLITAELLQHRRQQLGHQDKVATAMALASRNQAYSKQQDPQEDLILKRAIGHMSATLRHPLANGTVNVNVNVNGTATERGNSHHNSLFCTEQNLSLEKDICFGRGQRVQRRQANIAFRRIVATYQETYDQAVSREDKKAVVKKVARIFSRTGYRFFKESEETAAYGNGSKLWIAVSDHHVEYKIGHSFRSGRKQLKNQKNQRNQKETTTDASAGSGSGGDAPTNNKIPSRPTVAVAEPSNRNQSVYKEDELSDKCICIGDKREKYTGMEAYQYFREFILTFKSIFGMTESFAEKSKMVSSLIEQIKSKKGYRFLKLMPLKKDVEFWIEASADEISCEVFSILGNPVGSAEKNSDTDNRPAKQEERSQDEPNGKGQTNPKRCSDATESTEPKKRQRLSQDTTPEAELARPASVKRIVSGGPTNAKKPAPETTTKGDLVSSSSASSTTKVEENGDAEFVWKKRRKRTLPEGLKKQAFVPSEIICKPNTDKMEAHASASPKSKNGNGTDPVSKIQRDTMSAISMRIPPSLISPGALLGNLNFGNRSPAGTLERSLETLQRSQSAAETSPGRSTLEKALHAMRPSIHRPRERPMAETANLEAAKEIEMKERILLQHLRQQELLYIEKKHKLAMLDLQLRSRNGGV